MDIQRQTLEGLSLFGPAGSFDQDTFGAFIDTTFKSLAREIDSKEEEQLFSGVKVDPVVRKEAHAALVSLVLEASRQDAGDQEICSIVEDRMTKDRVVALLKIYDKYRGLLRQQLRQVSSLSYSSIVGIDWRLDYYIQSNSLEQVRVPVYFVDLKTEDSAGAQKTIQFTCSLQELQDLLAKCKDACNSVKLLKAASS